MNARHISRTETAKLIRKALKREFPGIKFSVRSQSYSGGGSIDTTWVDGPTESAVKKVIGAYDGKGFDGMIDLPYYYDAWLSPDGSVSTAKCKHLDIDNPPPTPDAELVHFSCGYNGFSRLHSPELVKRVAAEVSEQIGWDAPEIIETTSYWSKSKQVPTAYFKDTRGSTDHDENVYRDFVNTLHKTDANEPAKSEIALAQEEFDAWKAEQDALETAEPENEQELTQAITEATVAEIDANRAAADAEKVAYQRGYDDEYADHKNNNPYQAGAIEYLEYKRGNTDAYHVRMTPYYSEQDSCPAETVEQSVDVPDNGDLHAQFLREINAIAREILDTTDSEFIRRCVTRKAATVDIGTSLKFLIQTGDDLVLMAEQLNA